MLDAYNPVTPSQHEKRANWPTAQIQKYLKKYTAPIVPGKCSAHRRKKIKFLQNTLVKREKAEALILNNLIPF